MLRGAKEDSIENTQVIFDIEEVPFVPKQLMRMSYVDKIKLNDDHSMLAFTVDVGNTERLTGGLKDLSKEGGGHILRNVKLENVC